MRFFFLWLLLIGIVITSCKDDVLKEVSKENWNMDQSVDFNKELHKREELAIEIYLAHHKDLKMTKTGSGIRYQFSKTQKGSGYLASIGDLVVVDLKIELLDGRICYNSDSIPDRFVLGMSDEESGLQEVLQLMRVGDKSKIIVPSYLAHGLMGDSEMIPPQSILVIDVELLSTNE